MIPDLNFIETTFSRFNSLIFRGYLPRPEFQLSKARSFQGKLLYIRVAGGIRNPKMRISTSFDLPAEEWEDVVIHEMIHLRIALDSGGLLDTSDETSHGPTFRRMMADINRKHGRNITISAKSDISSLSAEASTPKYSKKYICLGVTDDRRLAVFHAMQTRLFQSWERSGKVRGVNDIIWIGSIDPIFNRIRKARDPKFYIVPDPAPFIKAIKKATPLQMTHASTHRRIIPDNQERLDNWIKIHF